MTRIILERITDREQRLTTESEQITGKIAELARPAGRPRCRAR